MRWTVEHVEGSAQELHDLAVDGRPLVRVHHVQAPALVLGSRQTAGSNCGVGASTTAGGIAVRRSGGGAVWLAPGEQLWVDVVVPTGDPLHRDDIRVAAYEVGDAWSEALGSGTRSWRGAMTSPGASAIACFAGLGPGEVTVGGRKLVGISQRRTRQWSRFQCVAYHHWDPETTLMALGLPGAPGDAGRIDDPGASVASALRDRVAVLADIGAPQTSGEVTLAWTRALIGRLVARLDAAPGS